MKKSYSILTAVLAATALFGTPYAYAYNTLQLDIEGGTYDPVTQTIVASGSTFTLYSLLEPDQDTGTDLVYYISAAITPKLATQADLGSFTFNGVVIDVTDDMFFGTPPIADVDHDLQSHGIFETYYSEFAFQFDETQQVLPYNTAETPGTTLVNNGTGAYWKAFTIDVSELNGPYVIHFDLYTHGATNGSKTGITEFAPFSHDAQSAPVPEPATTLLIGMGVAGLAGVARRKKKA